ncbi:MAG: 6-bladed beta-propeller [Candidatus Aminicenantes bacterium]|nr:6-bladed beta-propeller [Candidatus Aminicenantes bacterium]
MRISIKSLNLCVWLALAMLLCLPGCKKREAAAKVETIDGVTYVHNPAMPLHPEKTVTFEEELTLNEKDETGEIRLYRPGRFIVDGQGHIYIEDDSDMSIKVFDVQGRYLRSIGRKGSGPGEFGRIFDLALLPDGRLLVTDFETRRTSFFSPEGQFISSFQWKKFFSQVHLVTDSSYTVNEMVASEETRELWVKTIDFNGEELVSFGKFVYPEFKILSQGDATFSTSVPYSPRSVFIADQARQLLYHCLNDKYLIEVYDADGNLVRKIDRPYEPPPVTGEDIEDFLSRFKDRPDSPFAKMAKEMELPKFKTVTDRMIIDSAGNLWVKTNEDRKEGEKTFTAVDIFDPEGMYDARVWLEFTPLFFPDGKMYRMVEDEETGFRQLKRYRVVWQ